MRGDRLERSGRGDRPLRQSLCRPVHPRSGRGADLHAGQVAVVGEWPAPPAMSASPAAPAIRAGAGAAMPAANGTPSSRRRRRRARPRASRPDAAARSISSRWKARARRPSAARAAIAEFDRVVGGGLVKGSALLIGGDPGIGKSTLVLQVAAALGRFAGGRRDDLHLRRGVDRAGPAARPAAGPGPGAGPAGGRHLAARYRRDAGQPASRPSWSSSIPSRPCMSTISIRRPARWPRSAPRRPS